MATRHKRGDVDPATGLVYWDTFKGRERWRAPEIIARWRAASRRYVAAWQKADLFRHRESQKKFRLKHGKERNAKMRDYRRNWKKARLRSDPLFRLRMTTPRRISLALKRIGSQKRKSTILYLGCSALFLREWIERQFKPGMNWANYGISGWHIDHKIPLSRAKTEAELIALLHYSNLQPLWWYENLAKGSKYNPNRQSIKA